MLTPEPLLFSPHLRDLLKDFLPPTASKKNTPPTQSRPTRPFSLPHLTLTYATSLDSQISLSPGVQTILSNAETKSMTHYLRANHDAILIGAGTARADNPGLNSRFSEDGENVVGLERQPRPIVLDPRGSWRVNGREKMFELARGGRGGKVMWIVGEDMELVRLRSFGEVVNGGEAAVVRAGRYNGVDLVESGVDWEVTLKGLAEEGIRSVMVEGGATVINDLLRERNQKFVSSVIVTIAPRYLGAGGVVVAPPRTLKDKNEANLREVKWVPMGEDVVLAGRLR